jgi:hypothetical protein
MELAMAYGLHNPDHDATRLPWNLEENETHPLLPIEQRRQEGETQLSILPSAADL